MKHAVPTRVGQRAPIAAAISDQPGLGSDFRRTAVGVATEFSLAVQAHCVASCGKARESSQTHDESNEQRRKNALPHERESNGTR